MSQKIDLDKLLFLDLKTLSRKSIFKCLSGIEKVLLTAFISIFEVNEILHS